MSDQEHNYKYEIEKSRDDLESACKSLIHLLDHGGISYKGSSLEIEHEFTKALAKIENQILLLKRIRGEP